MRRRRGLFTVVFLISCFIYFNWLLNISDSSYNQLHQQQEELQENSNSKNLIGNIYRKKKKLTYYEVFESYENIRVEKSNQDRFVLLTVDQRVAKTRNKEYDEDETSAKLSRDEVKDILDIFSKNEVFLLDLDMLKSVKFTESNVEANLFYGYKYSVKNFLKVNNYFQTNTLDQQADLTSASSSHLSISFGIFIQSFSNLNKELIGKLNSKCRYIQMSGSYFKEKILTNLYIECKLLTLQISIVYERGDFLWIGSDDYKNEHANKYFGDTPRALNKFKLATITDESGLEFNMPSDLKRFLFDYQNSKFLECNTYLAKKNIEKIGKKYAQNEKKNKMISPVIEHLSNSLEGFYKHYWLAGGTLLGWYRDCGIIPHTQDVDMAIWAHEYDARIKKHFLGNKIVRVWGTLGLINDSFEFRLYNDQFTFDMFMVYKTNLTHQWCGYQINRVKFK